MTFANHFVSKEEWHLHLKFANLLLHNDNCGSKSFADILSLFPYDTDTLSFQLTVCYHNIKLIRGAKQCLTGDSLYF